MIDYVLKSSHEEIEHLERIMREDIKVGVDEREIAKSFLEEIKEQYVDREAELKEELNIAQG
jgi:hypothetical protein